MGMRTVEENEDFIEYEEIKEPIAAKVSEEIKQNGNKTEISMDGAPTAEPSKKPEPESQNNDKSPASPPPPAGAAGPGVQQKAPF